MIPKRNIVFWQRSPSFHQSAYIRALAQNQNIQSVRGVFMSEHSIARRKMGFPVPDFGNVDVIIDPDIHQFDVLLDEGLSGATNIVSEIVAESRLKRVIAHPRNPEALVGLLSEGRDWRGVKGLLRRLHSFGCERLCASKVDFVLAIGHMAKKWFSDIGFSSDKIFEFCYVTEERSNVDSSVVFYGSNDTVNIVFVGQLITRKRVDVLLKALGKLSGSRWTLSIIGDGVEKEHLVSLAERLGISASVGFQGVQDNSVVRAAISKADVLVLPSRWDGWGAVVNEALMGGVRVVCSDFCGAADLVRDTAYGGVFASGSVEGLANELSIQIGRGPVTGEERESIRRYSKAISGPVVAKYLLEIIDYVSGRNQVRPIAPWKRASKIHGFPD